MKNQPNAILPDDNAELGIIWWNSLPEHLRAAWLRHAQSAAPIDAWRAFQRGEILQD